MWQQYSKHGLMVDLIKYEFHGVSENNFNFFFQLDCSGNGNYYHFMPSGIFFLQTIFDGLMRVPVKNKTRNSNKLQINRCINETCLQKETGRKEVGVMNYSTISMCLWSIYMSRVYRSKKKHVFRSKFQREKRKVLLNNDLSVIIVRGQ